MLNYQRFLSGCLLVLGTASVLAQVPVEQAQPELANIRLVNNPRLFAVMAALNLAGFDNETPGHSMSEVRASIRRDLQAVDPELVTRLKAFYGHWLSESALQFSHPQVAFTSLALLVGPPPDFKLEGEESELPYDVQQVKGFEKLVAELYLKGNLEQLWQKYEAEYSRELGLYPPILRQIIQETLSYLHLPVRIALDREIILIPDLLDVSDIVNARNLEKTYYIVVGPSEDPAGNSRQLQHEYLHFLLDPLINKYGLLILKHEQLLDQAQRQPRVRRDYQNKFMLVATESLIEAIQLRLNQPSDQSGLNRAMVDLYREGLVLAPYFHRNLESFERTDLIPFSTYLESILTALDPKLVQKDESEIAEMERRIVAEDAEFKARVEAERQEMEKRATIQRLFKQSSQLISDGKLDPARERLSELLILDPDYGNAHFYLGQIAAQQNAWDSAFEAYKKASQCADTTDWVRAWSLLRMGRILASRQQWEDARRFFELVIALPGDLRGAREEAQKLVVQLEKPR